MDNKGEASSSAADIEAADKGGCRCGWRPVLLFKALLVMSLVYLWIMKQPTANDINAFVKFVTVEVSTVLFIKNTPAFFPILAIGLAPIAVWYIPFVPLSVLGWFNAIRFYYYYFISGAKQFPAVVAVVNKLLTSLPEAIRSYFAYFFPVCVAASGSCSITADAKQNLMIGLWWEDAMWLLVVLCVHIILDGVRYRQSTPRLVVWVVAAVVLGWDTVAPVWFIWLHARERVFATYDEPKVEFMHSNGVGVYCYAALALVSVSKWWVPLLDWAVTRGTIEGQLADGLVNPFGARATILIMATFFVWTIVWIPQLRITQSTSPIVNFIATNVIRILVLWLFMGNVAGAASTVLLFREFTPNGTYVGRGTKPKAE